MTPQLQSVKTHLTRGTLRPIGSGRGASLTFSHIKRNLVRDFLNVSILVQKNRKNKDRGKKRKTTKIRPTSERRAARARE